MGNHKPTAKKNAKIHQSTCPSPLTTISLPQQHASQPARHSSLPMATLQKGEREVVIRFAMLCSPVAYEQRNIKGRRGLQLQLQVAFHDPSKREEEKNLLMTQVL